jgi:hypothetical protein
MTITIIEEKIQLIIISLNNLCYTLQFKLLNFNLKRQAITINKYKIFYLII